MTREGCADHLHLETTDGFFQCPAVRNILERREWRVVGCDRFRARRGDIRRQRLRASFKLGRKMIRCDDFIVDGTSDDPLNFVAELPDISFPVANHQQIDCLRRESDVALSESR